MEPPTVRKILGPGWTYCPRCDANSMVKLKDSWHCPWCGITVAVGQPPPIGEIMVWSEPLTGEEMAREYTHLQAKANAWVEAHKDMPPPKMPERLRWFLRVVRPIAWLFACQVVGVRDKKDKEDKIDA